MYASVLINIPVDEEFTYEIPPDLEVEPGRRVIVPFGRRSVTAFVIRVFENLGDVDYQIKKITRVVDKDGPVFTAELVELARFVAKMYLCSPGQALCAMVPSGKKETESSLFDSQIDFKPIKALAEQQERALKTIEEGPGMYYLYGVTGSGKSEVFLRSAEEVIKRGEQVIYLVPEITLTHQLTEDVMARFSSRVAILHSALTPSQRLKQWHMIMNHEVDLVIGARSAIFAPCKKLGLIIMDEEHENSYKSGNTPRYHARQVAQKRASMHNISFIMGSATPSLEAWAMMEKGLVKRIEMPFRVAGGSRPHIEIVSMLGEKRCISLRLENEIRQCLINHKGVILFLNRRGYSYYYHCEDCGKVIECPNCSLAMTYHKKSGRLHCHYCGYNEALVEVCPSCGSTSLMVAGHGTEKVEEEAGRLFPSARIERLDTDVANGDRGRVAQIIQDFRDGEIDILLGTQMVAKGLNFPRLALVGVINADSTLSIPDFRAEERTYSLLEQVAGRAGRYDSSGKVIIQTFRPADKAIQAVKSNSARDFYAHELEVRKVLSYPPFSRFLSLVFRSRDENISEEGARSLADLIGQVIRSSKLEGKVRIVGLSPCLIERRNGSWRYQILLSGSSATLLSSVASHALSFYKCPSNLYIELDVDPLSLL